MTSGKCFHSAPVSVWIHVHASVYGALLNLHFSNVKVVSWPARFDSGYMFMCQSQWPSDTISTSPVYLAAHCSATVSSEEYKKFWIFWEMSSGTCFHSAPLTVGTQKWYGLLEGVIFVVQQLRRAGSGQTSVREGWCGRRCRVTMASLPLATAQWGAHRNVLAKLDLGVLPVVHGIVLGVLTDHGVLVVGHGTVCCFSTSAWRARVQGWFWGPCAQVQGRAGRAHRDMAPVIRP